MQDYDVVVIGAGLGGLSAGALLASQGRNVVVLEQSDRIGGCCSTFEKDGYHFDVGASIVEIIQPIEKVFSLLGTTLQKEVDLIPCDPIMSFIYKDGEKVTIPLSVEETGKIIRSIDAADGERWDDYVTYCRELMEVSLDTIFSEPASTIEDMVNLVKKNPRFLKFLPTFLTSYQALVEKYFKNDKVLKTMGYQSLYFGLPPAIVPGPYGMVPYSEHAGVYYPKGGMIKIPEALKRIGEKFGLQVKFNHHVTKILVEDQKVIGVRIADGTEIRANIVVSDINARTVYNQLIGPEYLPPIVQRGINSYKYSISVPMLYVGLDYKPPLEAHHSIIAASPEDINQHWWNNMEKNHLAYENFGLICWSTHTDPSLAPENHHILNLIPEGGYHLNGRTWDDEKPFFIEKTIENLSKSAIPGLKDHVTITECATPLDFERKLKLPEGAIYCFQQDLPAQAVFRPAAKSKTIKGLYLSGSSTHPGGGVPTTIASGMIAARLIQQNE